MIVEVIQSPAVTHHRNANQSFIELPYTALIYKVISLIMVEEHVSIHLYCACTREYILLRGQSRSRIDYQRGRERERVGIPTCPAHQTISKQETKSSIQS